MVARLILSISGNGDFSVSLCGNGKARRKLFKGYEKSIERLLPTMKHKVKSVLMDNSGGHDENTNPGIN